MKMKLLALIILIGISSALIFNLNNEKENVQPNYSQNIINTKNEDKNIKIYYLNKIIKPQNIINEKKITLDTKKEVLSENSKKIIGGVGALILGIITIYGCAKFFSIRNKKKNKKGKYRDKRI